MSNKGRKDTNKKVKENLTEITYIQVGIVQSIEVEKNPKHTLLRFENKKIRQQRMSLFNILVINK